MGLSCEEPVVEFSGYSFTYRGSREPALRDIDLCMELGRLYIVAGASGSGKTTLLRSIVGLVPHFYGGTAEGEVRVLGRRVAELETDYLAKNVGYVFQNPENQILMMSVMRDVALQLDDGSPPPEHVMRELGIWELRDRAPFELSEGQKQRVALAGAIAANPAILIMDEPTALLNPSAAGDMLKLVDSLRRRRRMTVVLVEHRLEIALPLADSIVVMRDGRIVVEGDPREVLEDRSKVAEALSAGVPLPPIVQVYHELRGMGVRLARVPLSVDELKSGLEHGVS